VLLFLKRRANARVSFYESSIEVRESQEYLDFVQAQEVDSIRFENTFIQLAQMELAQPF
jgi:hypothetical protein